MNITRVLAIAKKEFLHIRRDPRSLGMAIVIPLLLILLFGSSLSLDVDNVPLVIWDQSHSPQSREYIHSFTASPYFGLKDYIASYQEAEQAIDTREALLVLVIAPDFARNLASGQSTTAQLIVDGSDANTATIAISYAQTITASYTNKLLLTANRQYNGKTPSVLLEAQPRVWFNQDMSAKNYIVPGLIAVIMMVIAALLTSLTVAREWETGTMEQLITTPVKTHELILGKLIPYFVIGLLDVLLAVLMGEFIFHVPLRGSVALVFGLSTVFLAGSLAMGMLISIATRSQLLASQLAMILTFLPSFLLSGFMYAIANMPLTIQGLTYLIPSRYFVAILKNIYLKGAGISILLADASILLIFAVVILLIANTKFKKRLV